MLEQEVKNRIVRAENNFIGFSFLVTIRFVEKLEERCHGSFSQALESMTLLSQVSLRHIRQGQCKLTQGDIFSTTLLILNQKRMQAIFN